MTVDTNVIEAVRGAAYNRVRRRRLIANPPSFRWDLIANALFELAFSDLHSVKP